MRTRTLKQVTDPDVTDIFHEFDHGVVRDIRLEPRGMVKIEDDLFDDLPSEWPEPTAEDQVTWSRWHGHGAPTTGRTPLL